MRSNTIRRAWFGLLGHESSMDQSQEILLGHGSCHIRE